MQFIVKQLSRNYSLSFILSLLSILAYSQGNFKRPSSFFPSERANILLVGSFHFDYPGLDVIKIEESGKIDVLKEPKVTEVTELVNYILKFKPNKVAIEAFDSWNAVEKLRKYKSGGLRSERDERYQLAIRIATELNLDTLYSINATSFDEELVMLDSTYFKSLFKDYDFASSDPFDSLYRKLFDYEGKLATTTSLLNCFKYMNSRESHQLGYGAYLVGDFKLDNNRGADILSIWWYNRNLRIFRKLQQLADNVNDRIVVVIGNGHAAVLRQFIESSPEFKLVEFDSLN